MVRNKKKSMYVLTAILSVVLLIAITLSVLFAILSTKVNMPEVDIDYGQTFIYPDFIRNGTVIGQNAEELFLSYVADEYSWCYMGKMQGTCTFTSGDIVENYGAEIVKKNNDNYYSYCQTSSTGKIPIIGDVNINSAKRSYLKNGEFYLAQITDQDDYRDGEINWSNSYFEKATNSEEDVKNVKSAISFLARRDTIKPTSDPNVYRCDNRAYIVLDIDASKFNVDELLAILGSKLSSKVMEMGKSVFNLSHATVDLNELDIKTVVEFDMHDPNRPLVTGRDCILKGNAKIITSLMNIEIKIDMSMSAVISYDHAYYEIYSSDLMGQFED